MIRALVASTAALVALGSGVAPASAQTPTTVVAEGVALVPSASCRFGDIDVTYRAHGASRQAMSFTAAGGAVLDQFETEAFAPDYAGVEHLLTEAGTPPAAGTTLGVYASIGTTPPDAGTTAEFFVLYTCDSRSTADGGTNTVLETCIGPYGTCPRTADEALQPAPNTEAPATTTTAPPAAPPAVVVVAKPSFTG